MTPVREPGTRGQALTLLTVALAVVLGAPQVWDELTSGGGLGLASVFFPVLGIALSGVAVSRGRR